MTISTTNYYRHDQGRSFQIEYARLLKKLIQRRFSGRTILAPNIDLKDYECRALIDWITVSIQLGRRTQHQWINDLLVRVNTRRSFVKPIAPVAGNASEVFEIRFQEPDLVEVRKCLDAIFGKFGTATEPVVCGLEVSLDFYPKREGELARAELFAVMVRHLYVDIMDMNDRMRQPRSVAGSVSSTRYMVNTMPASEEGRLHSLQTSEFDFAPPADATFYIGAREDTDHLVRIQNKVTDERDPLTGSVKILGEHEKRIRVEVTLGRLGLEKAEIRTLEDVATFRYRSLSNRYFRFRLPTFAMDTNSAGNLRDHTRMFRERLRLEKFLASGVIGLGGLDAARVKLIKSRRKDLIKHLATKGKRSRPGRVAPGMNGTLVAWDDMSKKIEHALRHLEERMLMSREGTS